MGFFVGLHIQWPQTDRQVEEAEALLSILGAFRKHTGKKKGSTREDSLHSQLTMPRSIHIKSARYNQRINQNFSGQKSSTTIPAFYTMRAFLYGTHLSFLHYGGIVSVNIPAGSDIISREDYISFVLKGISVLAKSRSIPKPSDQILFDAHSQDETYVSVRVDPGMIGLSRPGIYLGSSMTARSRIMCDAIGVRKLGWFSRDRNNMSSRESIVAPCQSILRNFGIGRDVSGTPDTWGKVDMAMVATECLSAR